MADSNPRYCQYCVKPLTETQLKWCSEACSEGGKQRNRRARAKGYKDYKDEQDFLLLKRSAITECKTSPNNLRDAWLLKKGEEPPISINSMESKGSGPDPKDVFATGPQLNTKSIGQVLTAEQQKEAQDKPMRTSWSRL